MPVSTGSERSGRVRLLAVAAAVPIAFAAVAVVSGAASGRGELTASPSGAAQTPVPAESLLPRPSSTGTSSEGAPGPTASGAAQGTDPSNGTATDPATVTAPAPSTSSSPPGDSSASGSATAPDPDASMPVGPAERPTTDGSVSVVYTVDTDDPVYFITVDDGMFQDPVALRMVQQQRIPITAFLTEWTTANNPEAVEYFKQITAYGGSIQNHTMLHASLDEPSTDLEFEICSTQEIYTERFGTMPWLLRPPYGAGAGNQSVLDTAASCGISTVVMWNVTVARGGTDVQYWDPPLRSGDIVLAHFEKDFSADLARILALGEEQGLRPASLEAYLR